MIRAAPSDLVASCSPHVQRMWGTHSTPPPFSYTLSGETPSPDAGSQPFAWRIEQGSVGPPEIPHPPGVNGRAYEFGHGKGAMVSV